MDANLLAGLGDGRVRELVEDLYPHLIEEAQKFLAKHDLKDPQLCKDVLFALLFSFGRSMGQVEGMALQLGISPDTLFNVSPKLLANGRVSPLRPDQPH